MNAKPQLTAQRLREVLTYDPVTGAFTYRRRARCEFPNKTRRDTWNGRFAGKPAGYVNKGYVIVTVEGTKWFAHRLAWLYMIGEWPQSGFIIDHIDRDGCNNCWSNLRSASRRLNALNAKARHNPSGLSGVTKRSGGKWQAQCLDRGKKIYLGQFDTPEEAHAAYVRKQRELPDSVHIQKEDING